MFKRTVAYAGVVLAAGSSLVFLIDCFTDTRDGEQVSVIQSCDLNGLDPAPSPRASVRVYVETAEELQKAVDKASDELKDACNAIDTELGLPTGSDAVTACQPINKRVVAAIKLLAPGVLAPTWFNLAAPSPCTTDPNAKAACITTCAGACAVSNCDPGKLTGKCRGTCTGTCLATGTGPCNGSCRGVCRQTRDNICTGECVGTCVGPRYVGNCDDGCFAGFNGLCKGTCTGVCDGIPINDAAAEAQPPEAGPPTNEDGNCRGRCTGICSSRASGACTRPPQACPAGKHSGGVCPTTCVGDCIAGLGSGCAPYDGGVPNCEGTCVAATGDAGAPCEGVCEGSCSQPFDEATCGGRLDCQQNPECDFACEVKAALSVKCTAPTIVEVEAITDTALYAALKKHGPALVVILAKIKILRNGASFITQRTTGDFISVGATGDLVRACVARGNSGAAQAETKLRTIVNADPTAVR